MWPFKKKQSSMYDDPPTLRQIEFLERLCVEVGAKVEPWPPENKIQASEIIDRLIKVRDDS
jgi:hypothetical protein